MNALRFSTLSLSLANSLNHRSKWQNHFILRAGWGFRCALLLETHQEERIWLLLIHSSIRAEKRRDEKRDEGALFSHSGVMKTNRQLASRTNYGVKNLRRALKQSGQTRAVDAHRYERPAQAERGFFCSIWFLELRVSRRAWHWGDHSSCVVCSGNAPLQACVSVISPVCLS